MKTRKKWSRDRYDEEKNRRSFGQTRTQLKKKPVRRNNQITRFHWGNVTQTRIKKMWDYKNSTANERFVDIIEPLVVHKRITTDNYCHEVTYNDDTLVCCIKGIGIRKISLDDYKVSTISLMIQALLDTLLYTTRSYITLIATNILSHVVIWMVGVMDISRQNSLERTTCFIDWQPRIYLCCKPWHGQSCRVITGWKRQKKCYYLIQTD